MNMGHLFSVKDYILPPKILPEELEKVIESQPHGSWNDAICFVNLAMIIIAILVTIPLLMKKSTTSFTLNGFNASLMGIFIVGFILDTVDYVFHPHLFLAYLSTVLLSLSFFMEFLVIIEQYIVFGVISFVRIVVRPNVLFRSIYFALATLISGAICTNRQIAFTTWRSLARDHNIQTTILVFELTAFVASVSKRRGIKARIARYSQFCDAEAKYVLNGCEDALRQALWSSAAKTLLIVVFVFLNDLLVSALYVFSFLVTAVTITFLNNQSRREIFAFYRIIESAERPVGSSSELRQFNLQSLPADAPSLPPFYHESLPTYEESIELLGLPSLVSEPASMQASTSAQPTTSSSSPSTSAQPTTSSSPPSTSAQPTTSSSSPSTSAQPTTSSSSPSTSAQPTTSSPPTAAQAQSTSTPSKNTESASNMRRRSVQTESDDSGMNERKRSLRRYSTSRSPSRSQSHSSRSAQP